MADLDLPEDVIEAQKAYDEADARVQELSAVTPFDEQARADLLEARAERLRLLEVLRSLPWWGTVPSKLDAERQLRTAARA